MKPNDLDQQELEAIRIRALQDRFPVEHEALLNWGAWSRDRKGMYPALSQPKMFEQYVHDETEGYGEESEPAYTENVVMVKAEREEETYDEKSAIALDERIHQGLAEYLRIALRTAYVDGGPREGRYYVYANCPTPDAFLERLQAGLAYVGRFV